MLFLQLSSLLLVFGQLVEYHFSLKISCQAKCYPESITKMASVKQVLNEKLIQPFFKAKASRHEIALGAAIGMFWALNPLVGIQMMLVLANWVVFKAIGIRFSSPIGVAMVWITNPVTMPFFYYGFYISGVYALSVFGSEINLG